MQSAEISYVPFGERPEPYPPGYAPDPARWSGRELLRVELDPGAEPGVLPGGLPACTPRPADARAVTARTSRRMRYIPADRLPARYLVLLEHVTDDPGALAVHGVRLRQELPAAESPDGWASHGGRLVELPVGGVLVAVDREADGTRHWRAWRVTPIGPPVLVYRHDGGPGDRTQLARLAALLDEDLTAAFAAILARYERSGASPGHVAQMRLAIEQWRFAAAPGRPKRRGRRGRPAAPAAPATGIRPRLVTAARLVASAARTA